MSTLRRRGFLGLAGAAAATGALAAAPAPASAAPTRPPRPGDGRDRRRAGYELRTANAERAYREPFPPHPTNGDEDRYPQIASYGKGLPHDEFGEVDRAAYDALRRAFASGRPEDFAAVPVGADPVRPQFNPLSPFALELTGADSHRFTTPPVPRLDSPEAAVDAIENYWMALLRDLPFVDYETSPEAAAAAADLSRYPLFRGPREGGAVTPATLFRGPTPGDLTGPYLSQFLLKDVQFGNKRYDQRNDTITPGREYLLDFDEWLAVQRGAPRTYDASGRSFTDVRYIRTARDMGHWTHYDQAYQGYLNAALILLATGAPARELLDPGNPYVASRNQTGNATWGTTALLGLIGEVGAHALRANLFQQFAVHRRLRPEAYSGRIEVHLTRSPGRYDGLIHPDVLESEALDRSRQRFGTALLPQPFPEGSPMSPEHPSGHMIVAVACCALLKAWFDEDFVLPDPVVPDRDGTALVPWTGEPLTLGGELDKLVSNVGYGRNFGSVHTRSSIEDSRTIGEEVAVEVLRDYAATTREGGSLGFTRFDGTRVTI